MTSKNGARWDRLAAEVKARREWLQLSHHGVSRRGGPSHETIRLVEAQGRANGFRGLTLSQLDRGLGWKQGIARGIVNGTAPADREEWNAPAQAVPAGRPRQDPEGMDPLPLALENVPARELAGALVAKLARRPGNTRLMNELMILLTTVPEDDAADDDARSAS